MRDNPEPLTIQWEDYGVNYRIHDDVDGIHISNMYEGQLIDQIERDREVIEAARAWNRCGPDSTLTECDIAEGRLMNAIQKWEADRD